MLKERLEITRKELQEQDTLNQELQSDLQVVAEDLRVAQIQRSQELDKIDEVSPGQKMTLHTDNLTYIYYFLS